MKTNQVMLRPMGQFHVEQRTKDGFFNATALLKQWNEQSGQQKQMSHYTDNASAQEFITALLQEETLKNVIPFFCNRGAKKVELGCTR